jgi:tetratricopeptide (TPR) repeat protein
MKADSYATQSRLGLADIALTERKLEESISLADEVISADPRNIPARRLRAMALRYSHRLDDARAELERVIKMAPQDKPAYLQLGLLEIELKDFRKAEMLFSKLRDLGGDSTDAAAGFAVMYTVRGQSGKAYEFLKRELKNSSDRAFAHELLAAVAIQDGQYDRAIDEYYSVLRVNPSAKGIYLKLADAFRSKGDLNSYVTALERAQKSAPGELLPTVLLAAALESKGQRDAAIQQYRRALELQPDDPRVLNNLAYAICEANLNLDEALRLAQRAVRKSPDQPNFADTLGWIYLKKSMPDDALQIFSNLLKKYPDDPSYRYHFGAALLKKGDMQGARVALMAAISNKPPKQEKEQILDLLARIN